MLHGLPELPRRKLRIGADIPGVGHRVTENAALERLGRKLGFGAPAQELDGLATRLRNTAKNFAESLASAA